MSTIAAEQVTIIRSGLDPSNYVQGAEAIQAANAGLEQSGERVAATDEKLRRGRAVAQTSFERLRRELDENARAQARYEAAQKTVLSALERGRVEQVEANRVLELARERYDSVKRAAEARAAAEEAAAQRIAAARATERAALEASIDAAIRAVRVEEQVMAIRARNGAQAAVNRFASVSEPMAGDNYAARAEDMAAYGAEMDRLRARFDPLFAASRNYQQALEDIADAEQRGAINAQTAAAARDRVTASFAAAADGSAEARAEVARLTSALDGYVHAMDPMAASLDRVTRAERDLIALREAGGRATPEQTAAVVRMREAHEAMATTTTKVTNGFGLQRHQVQNLSAQFVDLGVQVSSGGGILLPLIQQGPQAVDAVGGVGSALNLLGQVFTPVRLAVLATVGAIVGLIAISNAQQANLASLRGELRAIPGDYRAMADEVEASARRIAAANLGISREEARAGQTALRRSAAGAGITGLDFEGLARSAADAAVVLRRDYAGAIEFVGQAMRDPAGAVDQLRKEGFPGMTLSLLGTVEGLKAGGREAEAFRLVMEAMGRRSQGAAEDTSTLEAATRRLGSAWNEFKDTIGPWVAGAGALLLEWLTAAARLAGLLTGGIAEAARWMATTGEAGASRPRGAILDLIASKESGTSLGAYNAVVDQVGPWRSQPVPSLSQYSLGAVYDLQQEMKRQQIAMGVQPGQASSAVGRYQFVEGTLRGLARSEGLNDDTVFSPEVQDRLANALIRSLGDQSAPGFLEKIRQQWVGLRGVDDASIRSALGAGVPSASPAPGAASPALTIAESPELREALSRARGLERPPEFSTRETQSAFYADSLRQMQAAREKLDPQQDARNYDILTQGIRSATKALEDARGPEDQHLRAVRERTAAALELDPVQREVNAAVREYEAAMRSAGEPATEAGRATARIQKLRELGGAYAATRASVLQQVQSQEALGQAYGQGSEAVLRAANVEKALEVVRRTRDGQATRESAAVQELARDYDDLTRSQNANTQRAANDNAQRQIETLEKEAELIGVAADQRERELAAFRARQEAAQRPGALEDDVRRAEDLARRQVDLRATNLQLTNSWNELGQIGERAFDRIGSAITQAFATGSLKALNFRDIAKAALSEVAQAALRMAIVNPVLNAMDGGSRGTLGGVFAVASAAASRSSAANDNGSSSGGMTGYAQQGMQAYSMWDKLKGINPSSYINGTSSFSTGWSTADAALNTPLWAGSANTAINAPGAVTNAAGYGSMAQSSIDAAGSASAASVGSNGLTYGGAAMGALGIAGGAFAAYQGVQRGGVGGYTQAAGGVATAGLSAAAMAGMSIPVYGWIAAAALMVIGALLPGQKPSDQTGTANFSTLDLANPTIGGLQGDRFSQETRDQAQAIGAQLGTIAKTVGDAAGLSQAVVARYEVAFGARDGIKVGVNGLNFQGGTDEAGITAVTKAFASQMISLALEQTPDDNVKRIINSTGNADPDKTLADLQWYRTDYKALSDSVDAAPVTSWAKAVADASAQMEPMAIKAAALGLSLEPVNAALTKTIEALNKTRTDQFDATINGMLSQATSLRGGDQFGNVLAAFDKQRTVEWEALAAQILDQGFDQSQVSAAWDAFIPLKTLQRQQLVDQDAAARASNDNGLWDRIQSATGNGATLAGARWDYERRAQVEWAAAAKDGMTDMTLLARTHNEERLKIERDFNAQVKALDEQRKDAAMQTAAGTVSSLADYARGLRSGDASPLSAQSQYEMAQRDYRAVAGAAEAGDWNSITRLQGYSDTLLAASRRVNGSGAAYASDFGEVQRVLSSIADLGADRLTASVLALETRTQTQILVEELQRLRAEVSALRADTAKKAATPAVAQQVAA